MRHEDPKIRWMAGLAFLFALTLASAGVLQAAEPIQIGLVASITGPGSSVGEPKKPTAELLQDWVNQEGGINGRPLKILLYDSKSQESQALLATKKLIEQDKVPVVLGASTTGESLAMIPICEKAAVPMVSMASALQIATPPEEYQRIVKSENAAFETPKVQRHWIFKPNQTDSQAAEAVYNFMQKKGITKVGIISISAAFGDAGRVELKRVGPKYGISVVADEVYAPSDTDMTAQLTRIKGSGAQALVNWSIGPTQIIVIKNWKALAMGIPLFTHGFGNRSNIALSAGAAEGVYTPLGRLSVWNLIPKDHPQYRVLSRYAQDYKQRFKEEPNTFGGLCHDPILMVVEAMRKVGVDKAKIRDYLETEIKNWPGVAGVFNMSKTDHCGLTRDSLEIIQVVQGNWQIAK